MEKKLFGFFIPLCIIGFLGCWISTMFLGTVPVTTMGSHSAKDDGSKNWSISRTVKSETFTAEIVANPNIELYLSDVNAVVEPYDDVNISVEVKNTSNTALKVTLERRGDDTTKISIGNDSFFHFGLFSFNFDWLFGGNSSQKEVVIKIPKCNFDSAKISQGSGKSVISGITALKNDIDIGSGEFSFSRDKSVVAEKIEIDMGSGKATFSGMTSKEYDIDVGSGSINISNLTGKGDIDIGSGNAYFDFDESPSGILDMGSGYVNFSLPRDASTKFDFDIGSGSIVVNDGTSEKKFGHNSEKFYVLGNDSESFEINLGSGKVDIGYTGFTPGAVSSMYSSSSSALN
ncbi:MAG: DUF4097 family beta strand repeat-containing protein [Oscillospiraceae bacterium]